MQGPRGTKGEEFDQVLELANYVFRKSVNQPSNMGEWYPLIFNDDNLENMRIILEDGVPVSHIGISESEMTVYGCKIRIGSIGAVCTYPEYRKRGVASLLLRDCVEKLDRDGIDIMLISGGRGLYKRAGCVEGGIIYNFKISQDELKQFNSQDVEVSPYREENLEDVIKVYQKEPVRFLRSLENFRKVLSTGAAMNKEAEILTIHRDGQFLGYLVIQLPRNEGDKRVSYIAEYSGVREAILDVLKPVFNRYDVQELGFSVPFYDAEFIYASQRRGLKSTVGGIPGHTIKIINFPRFINRFRPYIEERLGKREADLIEFAQEDDKFSIIFGREQFSAEGGMLTQIVFGNGREVKIALEDNKKVSRALRTLFPLPFIWPGLNYV